MDRKLDGFCVRLYADVGEYWESKQNQLESTGSLKFGIFYSPVEKRGPDLMIIGANPGFDSDDDTKQPPSQNLFYDPIGRKKEEWKISAKLRELFKGVDREETLRASVVTNLLFFKSRCLGLDKDKSRRQGWCDNSNAAVRREIEKFCCDKVEKIVCEVAPQRILVLGLGTWDKIAEPPTQTLDRTPRSRLVVGGRVFGKKALGMIHPTGAQVSNKNICKLAYRLKNFLAEVEPTGKP